MEKRPRLFGFMLRFGLPIVVAIFYITAARNLSYTPESTYVSILSASEVAAGKASGLLEGGSAAPLWTLLLALGHALSLDLVLTAKILSLVFSCFGLVAVYLLAVEMSSDRILALLVTLGAALNPWLLQAGPSGTAVALEITLSLAALFFVERGDLAVGVLIAGLASLIAWQAAALGVFIVAAVWWRSDGNFSIGQKALGLFAVYAAVLAPWFLYAAVHGEPVIPELPGAGGTIRSLAVFLVLGLAACAGAILGIRAVPGAPGRGFPGPSYRIVLWAWTGWMIVSGVLWDGAFLVVAAPAMLILGYEGMFHFLAVRLGDQRIYAVATAVTAALILAQQLAFVFEIKPAMEQTIQREEETFMATSWVKRNLPDSAVVEAEEPFRVAYFLGRSVSPWSADTSRAADVVLAAKDSLAGYAMVHRPVVSALAAGDAREGIAVFRRE